MDSSASDGAVFVLLHVITCLVLFLVSSVYADHSPALQTPVGCFDRSIFCGLSVAYPLEDASVYGYGCGYPGFAVDCNDESGMRPFINISNHIYHVLEVDYESIKLVDKDVEGSGCPQPKRNFSFPSSPSWVNYDISTNNITVFYNCSGVPADAEEHLLCSKQDTNTPPSYAFYDYEFHMAFDWYGNCAQNVVVPFWVIDSNYQAAMKGGFWMGWSATDWCEDCERSGGRCWSSPYDNSTGCACKNDGNSYNRTCPRPRHQDNAALVMLY